MLSVILAVKSGALKLQTFSIKLADAADASSFCGCALKTALGHGCFDIGGILPAYVHISWSASSPIILQLHTSLTAV